MSWYILSPEALARIEEIKHLRFIEKWTLQEIADKFGVTRERVRQIVGNTGTRSSQLFKDKAQEIK